MTVLRPSSPPGVESPRFGVDAPAAPSRADLAREHSDRALEWPDYGDLWLRFPLGCVLDYGCGDGAFLERIAPRCRQRWGVDVDADRVRLAAARDGIEAQAIGTDGFLPFPDEMFDTVILMEVIEHVADERRVLNEIARVLRPGGRLLLTTPHAGLLTFLDPGNLKFIAPRLHRFVHCSILRRKEYYERRFGADRREQRGMIADFTTDQIPWHRHYPYARIRDLAPRELETVQWAVYFPGYRALWCTRLAVGVLTGGRMRQLPWPLSVINRRLSRCQGRWGDQLVVLFRKRT